MITHQDLQDAADKLKQQELPRQLHNKVLVGTQAFKYLDYLAIKYPNGAVLVRKIDKKRFKNKSISKKRYFISQYLPAVRKTTVDGKDAILAYGTYLIKIDELPVESIVTHENMNPYQEMKPLVIDEPIRDIFPMSRNVGLGVPVVQSPIGIVGVSL